MAKMLMIMIMTMTMTMIMFLGRRKHNLPRVRKEKDDGGNGGRIDIDNFYIMSLILCPKASCTYPKSRNLLATRLRDFGCIKNFFLGETIYRTHSRIVYGNVF